MRLTRRGWVAVATVVGAIVLAWAFGERSLNAVAAPTLTALLVAAVILRRADPPTVEYRVPRAGFPGEDRTLSFSVAGGGLATIRHSLPAGLTAEPIERTVSLPHTVEQAIGLEARGVYEVGPPEIRQRDPLGLLERPVAADATAELLVYPQVYALADTTLGGLFADPMTAERQEFDRLREYVPGDPLKNVHWKSSAKHDEFLVMEFAPTERTETVTVVGEADTHHTDRMAGAVATVAVTALDAGLSVAVTVPDGSLPPGRGDAHREDVLRLLARTGPGEVDAATREDADVVVRADPRSTILELPEGRRSFESLVTGSRERTDAHALEGEEVAA